MISITNSFFLKSHYLFYMTKRTYEIDASLIERADDLERIVKDKKRNLEVKPI